MAGTTSYADSSAAILACPDVDCAILSAVPVTGALETLAAADGETAGGPQGRLGDRQMLPAVDSLAAALQMLKDAKRPVIIVGYGAVGRMESVIRLAEKLKAPVLTTFKAKGQIADDHPLAAGVLGRSGTPVASWCMNESDLLLVFGASFSNHTGISAKKPIVQVDFDPMTLGKFHPVALPVLGEIGLTAEWLWQTLPDATGSTDQRAELAERWQIWREEKSRRRARERGRGMNSAVLFHALSELVPADAVIAVDVGNNTYSFGRYFECRGQRVLMSGYLGSIGFGFPAAMGAWAATRVQAEYRGRRVISISGDGGFGQYMAEFTTAVRYGMNLIHVLLNNNELGKISKEQRAGHWPVWQTSLSNPDFAAFAESCGGLGLKVEHAETLHENLQRAMDGLRPTAPDPEKLAAWTKGETGWPFVDACMRYLRHGGWLNFRMRAMLMSVASYHLWLDWRATGMHLARMFTDYEPGIHVKLPFVNNVRKFDSRILTIDNRPERFLTQEKKDLIVDSYVKWRITDVVQYFKTTQVDEVVAGRLLYENINNGLRDEFGKRTIQEVISGDRTQIMDLMTQQASERASSLGIEVVDVRVKKVDYPERVSGSVYQRMRAEREREARDFRSKGHEASERIQADADRQRSILLAEAYRDSEIVRGEGDAKATEIYARAYNQSPEAAEFYEFTRTMRSYKSIIAANTTLLLSTDSDLFKFLKGMSPPEGVDIPTQVFGIE